MDAYVWNHTTMLAANRDLRFVVISGRVSAGLGEMIMEISPNTREEAFLGHMLADYYLTLVWITLLVFSGWRLAVERLFPPVTWRMGETVSTVCLLGGMVLLGYTVIGSVPFWVPVPVFYLVGLVLVAGEGASSDDL